MEYRYKEYIRDVKSGKIITSHAVRKAVLRHLQDVRRSKEASFPFVFKEFEAQKAINFFSFLKGNEGKFFGKPLILIPWQQFLIAMIYGWRRKDNNLRRFRKVYVQVGKKSGKSTLMSGLQLYAMLEEAGAQVYSVAGDRDQARITFDGAVKFIEKSRDLQTIFTIYRNEVKSSFKGRSGIYQALANDYGTADGKNCSFLVVDEYFAFQHSKMVNAIESGMIMREQPLTFIITTAGGNKAGPCYELYAYLHKVLDGLIEDDTFFGLIYELDEGDSWTDTSKWVKALPSLGEIVQIDSLQDKLKLARALASEEWEFRSKILNQWLDNRAAWISSDIWSHNVGKIDEEKLAGADCWAAVDLSRVRDLTAFSLYFRPDESCPRFRALHYAFIPEDSIAQKQSLEHVQFRRWIEAGLVTATPGISVDYDYVVAQILACGERFNIRKVFFDPYNAHSIDEKLQREGFETFQVPQGIKDFSPLAKSWELAVLKAQIQDPNPIMAWCLGNAVIKPDVNGNYKPLKAAETAKIDLVITSIMAFFGATSDDSEPETAYYSDDDFIFAGSA
jgi:phage terminase large subunit-like protein